MKKNIFYTVVLLVFYNTVCSQEVLQEKVFVHTDKNYYHVGEIVWFKLYVADEANNPLDVSKVAYAEMLDANNVAKVQAKILLAEGRGSGSFILPAGMETGKYTFRAYTNWMKNFPPEFYFEKKIAVVNTLLAERPMAVVPEEDIVVSKSSNPGKQLQLNIIPDNTRYGTRKKINIELVSTDDKSNPVPAEFSVAVYRIDSLVKVDKLDIGNYFSAVPAPGKPNVFVYPPEYRGHIISGKIINSRTGNTAPNVTGYLSVPGSNTLFFNGTSDASGSIRFDTKNLSGTDELIAQTNSVTDSIYHIEILSPFSTSYSNTKNNRTDSLRSYPVTLLDHSLSAQVQQVFMEQRQNKFVPLVFDTAAFYGTEYSRYQLDDYVRFKNMEEVFREFITPVGVSKKNNVFHPFIYDEIQRKPLENDPLVLIDGVPVFKMNKLMEYDPLRVKSIDVVARKYYRGSSMFSGIINLHTYNNDLAGYQLDANAKVIEYDGLQDQRQFYSPVYATAQETSSRLPDFRNVLYWAPDVRTAADGRNTISFYSSDIEGRYVVVVQGSDKNGRTGSKSVVFEVSAGGSR